MNYEELLAFLKDLEENAGENSQNYFSTERQGQKYEVAINTPRPDERIYVDWLGKEGSSYLPSTKRPVDSEALIKALRQRGVEFSPLESPSSGNDLRVLSKLLGDVRDKKENMWFPTKEVEAFDQKMMQKRINMFERLLGGKAERLHSGSSVWKIGPILALLAALGGGAALLHHNRKEAA